MKTPGHLQSILFRLVVTLPVVLFTVYSIAQSLENKLLPDPILEQGKVKELAPQEQAANRRARQYPLKAPTIPHSIEGFQINKDFNQCLMCHASNVAPAMKAPSVAASHFANREGEYLAEISPRRYFCTQCHVPQTTSQPVVPMTID